MTGHFHQRKQGAKVVSARARLPILTGSHSSLACLGLRGAARQSELAVNICVRLAGDGQVDDGLGEVFVQGDVVVGVMLAGEGVEAELLEFIEPGQAQLRGLGVEAWESRLAHGPSGGK
jgi:hypothetical protein